MLDGEPLRIACILHRNTMAEIAKHRLRHRRFASVLATLSSPPSNRSKRGRRSTISRDRSCRRLSLRCLNERYFNLSIPCDRRAVRLNGRTALEIFEAQFQFPFNKRDEFQPSSSTSLMLEIARRILLAIEGYFGTIRRFAS